MTAGTTGLTLAGLKSLQSRGATRTHPTEKSISYFSSKQSKASKSSKKKSEATTGGSLVDLEGSSSKKDDGWNNWDDDGW